MAIIVKVQRPLPGASAPDLWLVYDERRGRRIFIPEVDLPPMVREAVVDKAFFLAEPLPESKRFRFLERIADQNW